MEAAAIKEALLDGYDDGILTLRRIDADLTDKERRYGAKVGVFTVREAEKGSCLGYYYGDRITSASSSPREFVFCLGAGAVLDPTAPTAGPTALGSACVTHYVRQPGPAERCNAQFFVDSDRSQVGGRPAARIAVRTSARALGTPYEAGSGETVERCIGRWIERERE